MAESSLVAEPFETRDEVVSAALAFVTSTSVFRQPKACRDQFERLALAVLALPEEADDE